MYNTLFARMFVLGLEKTQEAERVSASAAQPSLKAGLYHIASLALFK